MIFARFKIQGKQVRKSLKTANLELAKNKLAELERNERAIAHERRRGKMLFGEAMTNWTNCLSFLVVSNVPILNRRRIGIKAATGGRVTRLFKRPTEIRKITKTDCLNWAAKFGQKASPTAFNHTISVLWNVLEVGVETGVRYDNPARFISRVTERPKKLQLPDLNQFEPFVKEIEKGGRGIFEILRRVGAVPGIRRVP
jgi:hypothetical protein